MSQRSFSIALIAFAVVVAASAPSAFAEDATVPCVVGLSLEQAEALLGQAGFTADVQRVQGKPVGLVVSQEPGGLATRAKGSTVRLTVGGAPPKFAPPTVPPPAGDPGIGAPPTGLPPADPLGDRPTPRQPTQPVQPSQPTRPTDPGPPPIAAPLTIDGRTLPRGAALDMNGPALPTVLGQPAAQARRALRLWRVGVEYTLAVPALVGKVVNQWPHGGAKYAQGQNAVIVVAIAEPPTPAHGGVPQVERREWRAAMASLSAAGFRPDPTSVPSSDAERGIVLSQQPLPGSLAQRGASVRIRVGRGTGAAVPSVRPRVEPPAQPRVEPPVQPPARPPSVSDMGPPAGVPPIPPELEPPVAPPTERAPTPPAQPPTQFPTQPPTQPPVAPVPPTAPAPRTLAAPTLSTPAAGEAYPHRYGASFSWNAVAGASAYEWELEEELPSGAWQKVDSRMVPGVKFRPEKLQRARYRWRVRAVHVAAKGEWSGYRRLYMY